MEHKAMIPGVVLALIVSFFMVRADGQETAANARPAGVKLSDVAQEIDAAEVSFTDALAAADIPKLEQLLTDDFMWTHTTGGVEMKDEYLRGVLDPRRYKGFKREGTTFRIYDKSALTSGNVHITVFTDGGRGGRVLNIRYTAAYVSQNGRWRLAAWHNTRLPE